MASIINNQNWVLPSDVIQKASLEGTKNKLKHVYLSDKAKKNDTDFLFYKDSDMKDIAFVIDRD